MLSQMLCDNRLRASFENGLALTKIHRPTATERLIMSGLPMSSTPVNLLVNCVSTQGAQTSSVALVNAAQIDDVNPSMRTVTIQTRIPVLLYLRVRVQLAGRQSLLQNLLAGLKDDLQETPQRNRLPRHRRINQAPTYRQFLHRAPYSSLKVLARHVRLER